MDCIHHWIVNNDNHGICKKCKARRQFPTLADANKIYQNNKYLFAKERQMKLAKKKQKEASN